ncbi:MAG: outer membrane lipoprotein carrier protein LolA [Alphaproteobacteria bacterium]|nr:outer membrane lipoprotein carrier protein LolA [Alphaproteobacteria bacterium]
MKRFLFLFLIFFSLSAGAAPIPSDALVIRFLTHLQKMTLRFDQTKTIPEIEKSFKSSGIFQFEKNKGLIIKQERPTSQVFVSTLERYCTGEKSDSLKNLPHFSDAKSLVDHLLQGDLSDLNKIFEIIYFEKNKTWQMDMIPSDKDMKAFIRKIVLKGNINHLKQVIIEYADGTHMQIDYSPVQQDLTHEIKC